MDYLQSEGVNSAQVLAFSLDLCYSYLTFSETEAFAMALQESGEMYLETILVLSRRSSHVRSIDISEFMNYSKPSVSRAMGLLKSGGYIVMDADGFITLTDSGREVAEKINTRHRVLTKMLVTLGVSPETAEADACKIEHNISDESFEAIRRHMEQHK